MEKKYTVHCFTEHILYYACVRYIHICIALCVCSFFYGMRNEYQNPLCVMTKAFNA